MIAVWPLPSEEECAAYDVGLVEHAYVSYHAHAEARLADGSLALYPTLETVASVFRASLLLGMPIAVAVGSYGKRTMPPVDGVQ